VQSAIGIQVSCPTAQAIFLKGIGDAALHGMDTHRWHIRFMVDGGIGSELPNQAYTHLRK
jgi:hypothetical protein